MLISPRGTAHDLSGPDDAPVVVLIHGLGLTRSSTWGRIAPVLAERFRVLTYDLPGHGESAVPEGKVTLGSLGRHLLALMDDLGIRRAALVGFSLGGMINRRVALEAPDRVAALAILNSPHQRGPEQQRLVEARARNTTAGGPSANIDETLARWFTVGFRKDDKATVEAIRCMVLANDPESYAAHRIVLAEGVTELIAPDPPITLPMLVMTCENDSGSTPAMAHAIAAETPGAETLVVRDLQHLGLIEAPDIFADALMHFLTRNLEGSR